MVIRAAAHKHVPMMEWNPGEAVNPTSVMGATKRVAEKTRHPKKIFVGRFRPYEWDRVEKGLTRLLGLAGGEAIHGRDRTERRLEGGARGRDTRPCEGGWRAV